MSVPLLDSLLYMVWTKPNYDRQLVNQAIRLIAEGGLSDRNRAIQHIIVNNWRSSHGFPLQCIKMTMLKRAKRIDPKATIAQRLKRLSIY
jgi:hypothetical protein